MVKKEEKGIKAFGYNFHLYKDDSPDEEKKIFFTITSDNGVSLDDIKQKLDHLGKWEQFLNAAHIVLENIGISKEKSELLPYLRLNIEGAQFARDDKSVLNTYVFDKTGRLLVEDIANAIENIDKWLYLKESKELFKELMP